MSFLPNLPVFIIDRLFEQGDPELTAAFFSAVDYLVRSCDNPINAMMALDSLFNRFTKQPTMLTLAPLFGRTPKYQVTARLRSYDGPVPGVYITWTTGDQEIPVAVITGIPLQRLLEVLQQVNGSERLHLLQQALRRQPSPPILAPSPRRGHFDISLPDPAPPIHHQSLSQSESESESDSDSEADMFAAFGFTSKREAAKELIKLARKVLKRNDEDEKDVSHEQIKTFIKAAFESMALVYQRLSGKQNHPIVDADTLSSHVNFKVGSGFLTMFIVTSFYWIWMYYALHKRSLSLLRALVTFTWKMISTDQHDEEEQSTFIRLQIPQRIMQSEDPKDIIKLMRHFFSSIHVKLQKGLGASHEYWYHNKGGDVNADKFQSLRLTLGGIENKQNPYPHAVRGDDQFWRYLFIEGVCATYNQVCKQNAILMPKAPGCFYRAVYCVCPRGSDVCTCQTDKVYPEININEIESKFANLSLLVIVINIYPRAQKRNKDFKLLFKTDNFYANPEARVIMINNPNWRNGDAHCCLFVPPVKPDTETPFEEFKRFSFFNETIHHICRNKDNICPICGLLYPKNEEKAHFKSHSSLIHCEECGLTFRNQSELEVHEEFHCRHLGVGCSYEFADEIKKFQEKPEKERAILYADLESAIQEDGTHVNILCGWVNTSDLKVHISRDIKALFDYAVGCPNKEILVYFHNGEGYDFHFVLCALAQMNSNLLSKIDLVADSSEKMRYFTINVNKEKKIIFKDTFAYVSESLSSWLESTKSSGCNFDCFKATFPDEDKREIVLQKNPFPYNAIKSAEDLDRDISTMGDWFTSSNNTELFCDKFTSDELHDIYANWFIPAQDKFKWRTVFDYYKTYLKCDVAQLCDCMEFFCANVEKEFELDPHDYYGIPSLTWAAWLRDNEYELDQIPEEAFDIINSSIRGGQTGAMTRYFNSEEGQADEGSFCCDLDCNALYATVMMKFKFPCRRWVYLPYEAEWDNEFLLDRIEQIHSTGRSGFIEADFEVIDDPRIYSYVPVASKRRITDAYNYQFLYDHAKACGEKHTSYMFVGLCNVVGKHEHYCGHTRLFEFYLRHNFIKVSKVHRIVYAYEEPVFEKYVKHNLEQRKLFASDPIKKMLYKLMNNALYGKTYEDVTQRSDIRIILTSDFEKLTPEDVKREIMTIDKWTVYEAPKLSFLMDKPIYLGAAITEYSKLWMYKFFYESIRPAFPSAEVMYTDTDALTLKFPPDCHIHSFMQLANRLNTPAKQVIDTSNWPNVDELPTLHTAHNNEPGLFKSETGFGRIVKMIALRAKTYIMVCDDGTIKMSVKGCPMKEKAKLTFDDFYQVLFGNGVKKEIEYDAITSKYHIVKSSKLTRVVLSGDDRKRFISFNRINTYPLYSEPHLEALDIISEDLLSFN